MRCNPVGLIVAIILGAAVGSPASAQAQVWWRQFGTAGEINISDMVDDGQGGIIMAGDTRQSLAGPNAGERDAWIARYDATGTRLWIRQFGTPQPELGVQLASDGQGGVFASGTTYGSLWGPIAGGSDGWVARYNADGDQLWPPQFGSALWDDGYRSLTPTVRAGSMPCARMLWRFDADGVELWSVRSTTARCRGIASAPRRRREHPHCRRRESARPRSKRYLDREVQPAGTHIWSRQPAPSCGTARMGWHSTVLTGSIWPALLTVASAAPRRRPVGQPLRPGCARCGCVSSGPAALVALRCAVRRCGRRPPRWSHRREHGWRRTRLDRCVDGPLRPRRPATLDPSERSALGRWAHRPYPARSGVFHVAGWCAVDQVWLAQYSLPCRPDLTTTAVPGTPGYGVRNGILNNDDFFYYLAQFGRQPHGGRHDDHRRTRVARLRRAQRHPQQRRLLLLPGPVRRGMSVIGALDAARRATRAVEGKAMFSR